MNKYVKSIDLVKDLGDRYYKGSIFLTSNNKDCFPEVKGKFIADSNKDKYVGNYTLDDGTYGCLFSEGVYMKKGLMGLLKIKLYNFGVVEGNIEDCIVNSSEYTIEG